MSTTPRHVKYRRYATVPESIHRLEPYVPKPIGEVNLEAGRTAIHLESNENALGPSPLALNAAREALTRAHHYPEGDGYYLSEALAPRLGVSRENVLVGAGISELLALAARVFLWPGLAGVTSAKTFPLYASFIRSSGARLVEVPLRNYGYDLEAIAKALSSKTRIVYIANPNNPTGTMFRADEFGRFLFRVPRRTLVVLDEAYFEYVQDPGYSRSIELVREGRNLLVLRTFSKVYGLAGLRIGYGIGSKELVSELNKVRWPFNTSGVAQAAALAALSDERHVQRSLEMNRAGLAQLGRGLDELGVRYIRSVANFVLVQLGGDAGQCARKLAAHGVRVRALKRMGFPGAIRVTVGTKEENERFLNILERSGTKGSRNAKRRRLAK